MSVGDDACYNPNTDNVVRSLRIGALSSQIALLHCPRILFVGAPLLPVHHLTRNANSNPNYNRNHNHNHNRYPVLPNPPHTGGSRVAPRSARQLDQWRLPRHVPRLPRRGSHCVASLCAELVGPRARVSGCGWGDSAVVLYNPNPNPKPNPKP